MTLDLVSRIGAPSRWIFTKCHTISVRINRGYKLLNVHAFIITNCVAQFLDQKVGKEEYETNR
jgi:hypothetical protein